MSKAKINTKVKAKARAKASKQKPDNAPPIKKIEVAAVFESYPPKVRARLLKLRELIYTTAAATAGVGPLEETLKWGQPSFLPASRSGTTIRIDSDPSRPEEYALYVHCQTDLITAFRRTFPDTFTFDGKRAIVFQAKDKLPVKETKQCIAMALRYHLDKKQKARERS